MCVRPSGDRLRLRLGIAVLLATAPSCGGKIASSDPQADERAALCANTVAHYRECGTSEGFYREGACDYLTDDVACDWKCDLPASCEALLGEDREAYLRNLRCHSSCTCESARRVLEGCGAQYEPMDCSKAADCNCPYVATCDGATVYNQCMQC